MEEHDRSFDVCIVCALHEEAEAVLKEFSTRCGVSFAQRFWGNDHYEYQYTTIQNKAKEPLIVLVTWLPEIGPLDMAQELKALLYEFHPRFVAMTGICAGDIEMDFFPLALDQAGAYIEEVGCGLPTYLDLYRTHRKELLQRRGMMPTNHPEPVATTWSLSFQKVEQANPAAADLLRLCAFLEPDTIPEDLISEGGAHLGPLLQPVAADAFKLNEAIEELRKFSLIQRNPDKKILSIHRLVQAVLKDTLKRRTQRQWAERVVRAVNSVFPNVDVTTWSQCHRYLSQAQTCSVLIEQYRCIFVEAATLLNKTATYLGDHALYAVAEQLCRQALQIDEQVLGPTHPETAHTLHMLGVLHREQGQYKEAETYLQRALIISEQVLGLEHPDTAATLHDLGGCYLEQGQYKETEAYYRRALLIKEQVLGTDHFETAATLHELGVLHREQGRYKEAERYLQRALFIKEQVLGTDHPSTAGTLCTLGFLYVKQSRYKEAETCLQRALVISEQVQGVDHPDTGEILHALGAFYWRQRQYKEAEAYLQRALVISKQVQGVDHPDNAGILHSLGLIYSNQGRYEEAENYYQQALSINQRVIVSNHSLVGRILEAYAFLLAKSGHPLRAVYIYKQALKALGLRRATNDAWEVIQIYVRRIFQRK